MTLLDLRHFVEPEGFEFFWRPWLGHPPLPLSRTVSCGEVLAGFALIYLMGPSVTLATPTRLQQQKVWGFSEISPYILTKTKQNKQNLSQWKATALPNEHFLSHVKPIKYQSCLSMCSIPRSQHSPSEVRRLAAGKSMNHRE